MGPEAPDTLCLHHIFYVGELTYHTMGYYPKDDDLERSVMDCHAMAIASVNMLLQEQGIVILEGE
jgi:hypothetical protein